MNRLTFRTIAGSPSSPREYDVELDRLEAEVKDTEFQFDLDLCLTIGSDMITVTYPTGLRSPRIYLPQRRVTGTIFINRKDTEETQDPAAFFNSVMRESLEEIFERIEKKCPDFDREKELRKIAFL